MSIMKLCPVSRVSLTVRGGVVTDYLDVQPEERAKRYRAMAEDALRSAQNSNTERERTYLLRLATGWQEMAARLEADIERGKPTY